MSLPSAKKLLMGGQGADVDARALIARMATRPDRKRQALISRTIVDLKRNGVWAKADAVYLFAAHAAQPAMLNWRQDRFNCVPFYFRSGAYQLEFSTDRFVRTFRISGTGSNQDPGVAIDTGIVRSLPNVKMQARSAQFSWIGYNSGGGEACVGSNDGQNVLLSLSDLHFSLFGNGSGSFAISNAARSDRLQTVWREQGNQGLNIDGSNVKVDGDVGSASGGADSIFSFTIGGQKQGYSAGGQHRAAYFGARLSSDEDLALAGILNRYLREIGALT